jgi:two-component system nitrate/nitrite response regulator NarL
MKLLVIDDHTLFRSGLSSLLERRNIEVIAVGSGSEGMEVLETMVPDIVLLDLRMPEMGGLEVLRWIRQNKIETPVVMLTTSSEERDLIESLRLGAQGYLLKDMDPDDLVDALHDVVAGETIVAPDLTRVLARVVQSGASEIPPMNHSLRNLLTARELEVLRHITKGQSNKVIARNLGITDGTVKLHVKSILRKLNLHSRVEAAVMAAEEGLG